MVVSSDDVVLPSVDRALLDDAKLTEEASKVDWYIDDISVYIVVNNVGENELELSSKVGVSGCVVVGYIEDVSLVTIFVVEVW